MDGSMQDVKQIENQIMLRAVCHDMANALSIILTASAQYLHGRVTDDRKKKELVERISNAAGVQRTMITNLRHIAALLGSGEALPMEPTSFRAMVDEAVKQLSESIETKDIELIYEIPAADDHILVEPRSFASIVLGSLLSNAVKYSPPSSAIIIGLEQSEKRSHIYVKDHGIGIPGDSIPELFEFEHKMLRRGTAGEMGLGLGLPLAKFCVDRMSGSIALSSRVQDSPHLPIGTDVHVYLPRQRI